MLIVFGIFDASQHIFHEQTMADNKPQVLILGGLGFVGRNLVLYLVEKDLCKFIRVVDKLTFGMAHLGQKHLKAMENSVVEFIQGNLSIPGKTNVKYNGGYFNV